jgi:nucleoside-diphosphate-sugar epimerase
MNKSNRVLVTGNHGYIGSVMAPALARAGYDVVGLDADYFMECTLVPDLADIPTIVKDIRTVTPADLRGFDAVVHLAALSNDPIGNLNAAWTREINLEGTVRIAQMAKEAGVRRFLFSSSCIMYGMSGADTVDETSPLAPETEYARSKVKAEAALRELADERFSPTFCRNGTIYGLSPRMRFDTVLNDLTGRAYTTGEVEIYSDGTPWRPVVHVQDVARAFQAILEAPLEIVHNEAFNVGADKLNHQIRELAEIVADTVPGCRISFKHEAGADQRTYKARFAKFAGAFPEFEFNWTARDGARELYESFKANGLTAADFNDRRFTRLRWLRHLVDDGRVNGNLFWNEAAGRAA